ncbi:MAG: hypothetical protein H0V82_04185 [Candidatus Protochlamydia sp.]|nr:hypothetical protein [Candidatus Protochlamydia sp.]
MRNWITFLMTLLVGSSVSYINADSGQISFEAGYRRDNISWSHQIPACDPLFKTKTKFEDVDIFQIGLKARTMMGCNFYGRASAHWGWILDGDFKQSISAFAHPTFGLTDFSQEVEFKAENRDVIDDKYVYDLSIAIGYPFFFCDCTMAIAPVVGYAVNEQSFRLDQAGFEFETVADCSNLFFPTSGEGCCTRKYNNRWFGPFIGFDFTYRPCGECWSLFAEVEYHWAHFKAKFNNDFGASGGFFDAHSHRSNHAHGWVINLGADYDLSCDWSVGFAVKITDFSAHRHRRNSCDDSFFGSVSGREKTSHKWNSNSFLLAFGKVF